MPAFAYQSHPRISIPLGPIEAGAFPRVPFGVYLISIPLGPIEAATALVEAGLAYEFQFH